MELELDLSRRHFHGFVRSYSREPVLYIHSIPGCRSTVVIEVTHSARPAGLTWNWR